MRIFAKRAIMVCATGENDGNYFVMDLGTDPNVLKIKLLKILL